MALTVPRPASTDALYSWAIQLGRWLAERLARQPVPGTATLTTGTSTTVSDGAAVRGRLVVVSANAHSAVAGAAADGTFVLTHASGAADRTVTYLIV